MELDPGSISVEQLLALLAALNHEILVQPKSDAVDHAGSARVLARTAGAIEALAARLPLGFPQRAAATIFAGIQQSAKQLAVMSKS